MSEPLYYIRCNPDGSWLTTRTPEPPNTGLIFAQGCPQDIARLTEDEINSRVEAGEGDPIYEKIPVSKALHEWVTTLIQDRGPASFDRIFQYLRTRVPFDIKRFEVASMLNTMLRKGELQLENNGNDFMLGDNVGADQRPVTAIETTPATWSMRWPTKGSLIHLLQSLPFPDDYRVNVSVDQQDIYMAKRVDASEAPMEGSHEFLLNFEAQ
jgi:hypothetical protein